MEPTFWRERWERGQIGFHRATVNPHLERWMGELGAPGRVLVPLCGKSVDLTWLAQAGHAVTGVELSPLAVEAYFREAGLTPVATKEGPVTRWAAGGVEVLEGDVFQVTDAGFDAAWDRAATIALPPDLRARYAAWLTGRMRPGGVALLVTLEHAGGSGPPFSVTPDDVVGLYRGGFALTELDVVDADAPGGAGKERVFRMVRRS